ncbi:uncharacterized protein LOC121467072 [Drosophila elegans]|uniref:uncharacterized protein LOC121467072 n=1 Tax=Drosophila elegans TaxID=30023 RepID=UPI001BC8620C|nr:uncharacterized protein LOC121467072 [Drosophila elegans]
MWLANKFCCCINLQIGCTIISFFTLCLFAVHLVEFFRFKEHNDYTHPSDWLNLLWGILHLLASMCLSYSVLVGSLIPIWVYIIIEVIYLIYVIIYASVSCALKTNTYANLGLNYCITYWSLIVLTFVIITYFLYVVSSYYLLKRQQLIAASHHV